MMNGLPDDLKIIGLVGRVDSSGDFMDFVNEYRGDKETLIQFFDADYVLGREHIESAYWHAKRAFEAGNSISQSMAMEILIYVSGEPQIANALTKVGIKDGNEKIALIADESLDLEGLFSHLNLKQDDDVLECTKSKLKRFGIGEKEINSVSKFRIKDLILERVALVDVRK
jgi:KEOPS complex subunit Cgi121